MKRSPLLPIFLIVVVDILGLTIMLPLLPFYAEQFRVGPGVSGYLSAHYGFHVPILCAAGMSLTSILGTTFLLPAAAPAPVADVPAAPIGQLQEEEAPVAPGGRRLRIFEWKAYLAY